MSAESASEHNENPVVPKDSVKKKKKRSWFRLIGYSLVVIMGLYVCSLFVLNTSWAKSKFTSKLNQKSGLDWRCGRILWVPFSDITLHDLKTDLGSGGVEVKTISVEPDWTEMLKGDVSLSDIAVDGVNLDIDELWLEEYLKKQKAANPIIKQPIVQEAKPKQVIPNQKEAPVVAKKPIQAKPVTEKKPLPPKPLEEKAKWINVKNINFTLRRGDKILKETENAQLSIPFSGPEAEGFLKFTTNGGDEGDPLVSHSVPIQWKKGNLSIDHEVVDILGVKFDVNATLAIKHRFKMFVIRVNVQDQSLDLHSPFPNLDLHLHADKLTAQFTLEGSLTNPQSWLGRGKAFAEKVNVKEDQKTHAKLEFDYTGAVFDYMAGNLVIRRAEASSDDLVIFMNGVVRKDLYSYGVVRFIAADHVSRKLNRIYNGSGAIHLDHNVYFVLGSLDNPDRQYCDVRFDGKLTDLQIKHNRSDHWESLNRSLKALKKFKDKELAEDGLLKPENN